MEKPSKIIIVSAIALSFLVNSIMVTNYFTRRSAEELQKIGVRKTQSEVLADKCYESGGKPEFFGDDKFNKCN